MDVTLAGRPSAHLAKLGHSLGVPCRTASLDNPRQLDAMLVGVPNVVNTAGPFTCAAPVLMRACLRNGCNYLDPSNEAATFLDAWSLKQEAAQAGVAVVTGAGFGTAAAECLATHVSERIHDPSTLNIVRTSSHEAHTPGVKVTMLELLITPGQASGTAYGVRADSRLPHSICRKDGAPQYRSPSFRQIRISNPATALTVGKIIGPKQILNLPGITITDLQDPDKAKNVERKNTLTRTPSRDYCRQHPPNPR